MQNVVNATTTNRNWTVIVCIFKRCFGSLSMLPASFSWIVYLSFLVPLLSNRHLILPQFVLTTLSTPLPYLILKFLTDTLFLNSLSNFKVVYLQRIPGHSSLPGYDLADTLAKARSFHHPSTIPLFHPLFPPNACPFTPVKSSLVPWGGWTPHKNFFIIILCDWPDLIQKYSSVSLLGNFLTYW